MLVSVGGHEAGGMGDLEDGIDAEPLVRVDLGAGAIDDLLWEIGWVDAAGEELRAVVVEKLSVLNYGSGGLA